LADREASGGGGGLVDGNFDRFARAGGLWQRAFEDLDVGLIARERLELAERGQFAGRFAFLADGETGSAQIARG